MAAGIIDPTKVSKFLTFRSLKSSVSRANRVIFKVVRCCLEHASSVAKTFLMSDCVVVEIKEPESAPAGNPMDNSGLS